MTAWGHASEDSAGERARLRGAGSLGPSGRLARRLDLERDRWFLWLPVIYGSGIGLYFALAEEPGLLTALMPVPIALVLWLVLTRGTLTVVVTGITLALALGFAAAKLRTQWVTAPVLERPINLAEVRGWVEQVEPRAGRGQRITLRVASIRGLAADRVPWRVRVRTMATLPGLQPGDAIRVRATLAAPAIPALPGDHDFARLAFFQRLGGVGYALARPERDPTLGPPPLTLAAEAHIVRVRSAISQRVRAALPGERGAIADAMITGERGGISAETNAAYRDSGLFHILSISGLHMTVMAGAVFVSLRFALAAIPAIALRWPVKKWAAALATLAALGYLLISGAAFATVRAWVMISIMFLAVLLDRPALALRNVAVSALIILVVLPESLLDIGFQMSFAAVVALVAVYEAMREAVRNRENARGMPPSRVMRMLLFFGAIVGTTLIASIAVAPFAAYHFHKSQQYAILANLIAIPVCNIVVMPGALATLVLMPFGLERAPLWIMGLGIDVMTWVAVAVAALPGAVGRIPAIPLSAFLLMVAGGLWLCIWRTRWRLLGIAGLAAGLAVAPTHPRVDVLVGREAQLLAARGPDGRLAVLAQRGTDYELARWLEHDGDSRPARDPEIAGRAFRCDASGCTAVVKGTLVALVRHPASLADDCERAGLLILAVPLPAACNTRAVAIDLYELRDKGTHAVYMDGGAIRVISVAEVRGDRPWTTVHGRRGSLSRQAASPQARGSRLGLFTPPYELRNGDSRRRPEIEEEDDDGRP